MSSPGGVDDTVPASQLQLRRLAAIQSFIQKHDDDDDTMCDVSDEDEIEEEQDDWCAEEEEEREREEDEGGDGAASAPRGGGVAQQQQQQQHEASLQLTLGASEYDRARVTAALDAAHLASLERGVAGVYETHVRSSLDGGQSSRAMIRRELAVASSRARNVLTMRARERERQLDNIIRDSEDLIEIMNEFIAGEERAGARLEREHEAALGAAMEAAGNLVAEHIEQRIRRRVVARSARARALAVMKRRMEEAAHFADDDFEAMRISLARA